jgi:hypothetical protein
LLPDLTAQPSLSVIGNAIQKICEFDQCLAAQNSGWPLPILTAQQLRGCAKEQLMWRAVGSSTRTKSGWPGGQVSFVPKPSIFSRAANPAWIESRVLHAAARHDTVHIAHAAASPAICCRSQKVTQSIAWCEGTEASVDRSFINQRISFSQ